MSNQMHCARCSRKLKTAWETKQDGYSQTKRGGVNLLGSGSYVGPSCRRKVLADGEPVKCEKVA
jgi:hypothetical protein